MCGEAGLVFVPCAYKTPDDIKHCLQSIKPRMIIVEEPAIETVDQVIDECPSVKLKLFMPNDRYSYRTLGWYNYADMYYTSPGKVEESVHTRGDDVMSIYFTSGTVSQPKMVPHTHASYGLGHHVTGKYFLDLTRTDVHWNLVQDSGWAKVAWSSVFGPWSQGACVFVRQLKNPEPDQLLETLETFPITTLCSTPSEYRMLIQEDLAARNFHSLRHCVSAGELLNPDVIEKWEAGTGIVIKDGYGQSETTVICANYNCLPVKPGALGKPVPGYEIDIIDDDNRVLPTCQVGEIAVRMTPNRPLGLFKGYEDNLKETMKVFTENYYKTGDQGYMDEDGYLWFVSRDADIIHTQGVQVSPFDIENELLEHPAVAECAAVSTPDELQLSGPVIKAFIVLAESYQGMDEDELIDMLRQHAQENLKPTHQPRKYAFTDYIAKTATGKVKRSVMRNKEWISTTEPSINSRMSTTA
ncbi:Acyl-coenzyme A synthetase ACSM3, mitochondrial [Lamellibrachia satsuma]|nr:Acyl-coenzyme A synthetase ACSM3, mitochondrial [Lamellibrachia satsuma]